MKTILFFLFFCCLFSGASFAETRIKAEVDKARVATDQAFVYKVTITTDERNIGRPNFSELKDFYVLSSSQSSSTSFSQKGAQSVLSYAFVLAPKSAGRFTIPPCRIESKGGRYESEKIEIEVAQGKDSPNPAPEAAPGEPKRRLWDPKEPQFTL